MRVVVVGAGPVGVVTAIGLARQGHAVTVIDRDPGPPVQGNWSRSGVMQFRHPHGFRPAVHKVLTELMPDVWDKVVDAGCLPFPVPGAPPGTLGISSRRSTFEKAMRQALIAERGVRLVVGHARDILVSGSRLIGVQVASAVLEADCIVVATGRASHLGAEFRAEPDGGPCGFSYTSRMYRARRRSGPALSAIPMHAVGDGYETIVFPQDDNTLAALIVRRSTDVPLAQTRFNDVFDRVAARIPNLAPWVDPDLYMPITNALPGGGLTNVYQSVLDANGRCAVPGLLFVGDTVMTTNPRAGRGVATGFEQARALLGLLGEHTDLSDVAFAFDEWNKRTMRPWFEDHVQWDAGLLRRWNGHDLDLRDRIPSDVVVSAADMDRRIVPAARAYGAMAALPEVLDPFQQTTRSLLHAGWRPRLDEGPTRDELVELVEQIDMAERRPPHVAGAGR